MTNVNHINLVSELIENLVVPVGFMRYWKVENETPYGENQASIVSNCKVVQSNGLYFVISNNNYFTQCTGIECFALICWSEKPIEIKFISHGNVSSHAKGCIMSL